MNEVKSGNSETRKSESSEGKEVTPRFFSNLDGVDTKKDASEGKEKENIEKSNEVTENESTAIKNKQDGCKRENDVEEELKKQYPESEGYSIVKEAYLRDKDGNIVKDEKTGEARRVDFLVVKDGKVVDSIEVTSKTADKVGQTAKEYRIREAGGNYIKDNDGNLIKIPSNVQTRIERRD